ncbi:MAG: signal peptidase II [Candidatus Krumholzibacteriota bacterium]|nr:signal peptidase II [Candidatus Krumholzibacteriota bacterium]
MLYFTIAALIVILDQASKRVVWEVFRNSGGVDLIDGFLRITLSRNNGAVMGILGGSRAILLIVTTISIAALIFFAYRMRYAPILKRIYIGLILGGAFGNLIDRIATGEVIDFIDMGIGSYRWPTYNVADIAVSLGAVFLIAGFVKATDDVFEPPKGEDTGTA